MFWIVLCFVFGFSSCFSNISSTSLHRSCSSFILGFDVTPLMYIFLHFLSPSSLAAVRISSILSYYLHYSVSGGNMALSVIVFGLSWKLFAFKIVFIVWRYFPWITGLFIHRFRAVGILVGGAAYPNMYSWEIFIHRSLCYDLTPTW